MARGLNPGGSQATTAQKLYRQETGVFTSAAIASVGLEISSKGMIDLWKL